MIFEYEVIAKCDNKITSSNVEFRKNFTHEVEDFLIENNSEYLIYNGSLFDLISDEIGDYLVNNEMSLKDISIINVDVQSKDDMFNFIVEKNNEQLINFYVKIFAFYNKHSKIEPIFLIGEAIDDKSIKLIFSDAMYGHKIYDDNNNFIGTSPVGSIEYIEDNLLPGTQYCRKVVSYNSNTESVYSNLVVLTTKESSEKENIFDEYKNIYSRDNNISFIPTINENLKAFKSGIGSSNDLKIFKPNDVSYVESFGVKASLYGKYKRMINTFQKASFEYRTVCIGKYNENVTDGFVRFKFQSKTSASVKFRVYRYAHRNIDINWIASAWISYKQSNSGINQVMQIRLDSEKYTLTPSVKYNGKNAYLEPRSNLLVKSKPLKKLILDHAYNNYNIQPSQIEKVFDYALYDTCSFDRYTSNVSWEMKPSGLGTFSIHTMDKTIIDENSNIYGSGYSNAQLFDAEKIFEKTFYGDSGIVNVLTLDELNSVVPTNVDDRSETLPSSIKSITTKIDIISVDTGLKLSEVNLSNNNILTATANLTNTTPEIQYKFDNNTSEVMVNTSSLISNVDDSLEYEYGLVVLGCTNNITLTYGRFNNNQTLLNQGQVVKWIDTGHSNLLLNASNDVVVRVYEDVLPKYEDEAYKGVINGIIDENGECHKKDMMAQTPMFVIPEKVYDVRYKILIQNIKPSEAHVDYKFFNSDITNSTTINGDFVLFTSDASKKYEKEFIDLLNVYDYDNLHTVDSDISTIDLSIDIKKPNEVSMSKYEQFIVDIKPKSLDIAVDGYNSIVEFSNDAEVKVPFKAKIRKNATSKWTPLINNGHYYLNQNEYFLFSQSNIDSSYEDTYTYATKNSIYDVEVLAKKANIESGNKVYSYRYSTDYILNDGVEFVNNHILPKPTVDGIYFKQYVPTESLIKEVNFDSIVKDYNYIKWSLSNAQLQELQVFMRSYNYNYDTWNEWNEVHNNEKPNIEPSYKAQIKVAFNPNVKHEFSTIKDTISSYNQFKEEMDEALSNNIYLLGGGIQSFNGSYGVYVSKILKFEVDTKFKINSYYTVANQNSHYKVSIYVASSNDIDTLNGNGRPFWVLMDGNRFTFGKYFRYKILIEGRVNIVALYKDIETTRITSDVQGINNIQLSVKLGENTEEEKTFNLTKSYTVHYDGIERIINYNLIDDIEYCVKNNGYDMDDIIDFNIMSDDEDVELIVKPLEYDLENSDVKTVFNGWFSVKPFARNWIINETEKSLVCANTYNGFDCFISPTYYKDFRINAKINSSDFTINPTGFIIAYEKDYNEKEHILTLLVSPSKELNSHRKSVGYAVYYNYNMADEKLIIQGNELITESSLDSWDQSNGIHIDVQRKDNIVSIYRSQNNKDLVDTSTYISFNLLDFPILMIFTRRSRFGFCSYSQNNCKFTNIHFHIDDKLNSVICSKTKFTKTIATSNDLIEFCDNKATMSPLPQQYAPIIVETFDSEPLRRVYFKDGDSFVLYNTEIFSEVNNSIQLTYTNIDENSLEIFLDDELINYDDMKYTLVNNYLFFDQSLLGYNVCVTYKLKESFVVNYNIHANEIEIEINTEKENKKAFVTYETNEFDSRRRISHLSLNPIYNATYDGFIYLSNKIEKPTAINAYYYPKYVIANGNDILTICVKVTDYNENPVPNESIDIECNYGLIEYENKITDYNGIITFKYHSTAYGCIDNIKISSIKHNLIKNIDIENLEV